MSGGTRKLSLSFDARDKISDQALRDEKMKNQDKLLSFFFFEKWILFKPFQSKGLNFMDEDLCFH